MKETQHSIPRAVVAFLLLATLFSTGSVLAQGKLAGRVTDEATGESLIGVNILVESTLQGTITDVDGNYIQLNLRPGDYTILYSYVGYASRRLEGVRIVTNQTTRHNVELSPAAIEGQEIIVQAERPLVQKDMTASKRTVVSEEIALLPVENFFDVLSTQAGVTQGAGGELHIRGGRSNEIGYLVDGLSVANPFNTNGVATEVSTNAIQEMTVVSGAFNAEYGQAMSGIVNIVTKEGGADYDGSVRVTIGDYQSSNNDLWGSADGLNLGNKTVEATLGGPILGRKLTFFAGGRWDDSDGYRFGFNEHAPSDSANFNTGYYEIQGKSFREYVPLGELAIPDERVTLNSRSSHNFTGKIAYRPRPQMNLSYTYLRDGAKRQGTGSSTTDFLYKYNPFGLPESNTVSSNHALHWTHTLNRSTFYTAKLSYAANSFERFLYEDPTDERYVRDIGTVGEGNVVGFPGNNFYVSGNDKNGLFEDSKSFRGKVDLIRQFGTVHEGQAGVVWNFHTLDRTDYVVQFDGNVFRQPTLPDVSSPSHNVLEDQSVNEVALYAQDKIEFDDFIINVGLRYDRFDPNGLYIPDGTDPWADRLDRVIETAPATPKDMVSPRFGMSFPITSRGVIHFSYGHFYQMPTLRQMFVNPEFEFPVGEIPTFSNANLRPQKTVSYEFGLQQQIGEQLAFDLTGFFRDIRDYLALQRVRFSTIPGEDTYRMWSNKDYANVQGITFALTKRRSRTGLLSANIDYTFLVASGNNNAQDSFFFNLISGREDEFELVPLDFDQRHNISATITLSRPNNWGLSFIGKLSTGYPYTPVLFDQTVDLLPNSDNKPLLTNVDVRLFKNFNVGAVGLSAFVSVFNLLDRLNERFVFDDTGRAGSTLNRDNIHAFWQALYGLPAIHELDEYNSRAHYFSPPREIRIGLSLNLN
jgi:outer membrane receptor for ferrienterochelin and colicin